MEQYAFPNDPVANPDAIVTGDNFRFTLIGDHVLRYEWAADGVFEDRPSTFALNRRFPTPKYEVHDNAASGELHIRNASFHLAYDKQRFSRNGLNVSFSSKTTLWGAEWRFGDTPANLGGTARTLDEVDGRCELASGVLSRSGFGVVEDSESMLFDGNGFVAPRRSGDRIDGYLFFYGHDFKAGMKAFFAISGKQPLLPRWALGNWWSRYYAYRADEYLELMDKFTEQSIPLSVAVIDMDWHEVHGDHIPHAGWTGYTWNKELFPDPVGFTKALHDRKLKITLNDHPHSGVHLHEELYEEMAKALDHDTSTRAPILFDPTSPKFMHAYFNLLHRHLEKDGCDFWWIDWQQGPFSRVPGLDPLWLLNHFHFLDNQQQFDGRGLIFSRFAGPGSHRYPVGFSGDAIMTWESLQFQPEFTATASNIGYGWWSHDIGGHMGGYRDDELATRWVQFGVFSPIMRLHSSNSLWSSKEPWLYRQECAAVMKKFMQLRHRMLPYLYTMNASSAFDDEPLVQPLYWKYPSRDEAYEKPNQYYFGSSLVVSPIVRPRNQRTNSASVDVWVPPGRHVDIFNGIVYDGDRQIAMYRPIEAIPILAPEGAIIPLDKELEPMEGCINPAGLEMLVVVGKDGALTVREEVADDIADSRASGDNRDSTRNIDLSYTQATGQFKFETHGKAGWRVKFVSVMEVPANLAISVNGATLSDVKTTIEQHPKVPGLTVEFPELSKDNSTVVIDLGADPQLSVIDVTGRVKDFIWGCQVEMAVKDQIWQSVQSSRTAAVKIGELVNLRLDQDLIGPIIEFLAADSRTTIA